jgi:hypothetical protein
VRPRSSGELLRSDDMLHVSWLVCPSLVHSGGSSQGSGGTQRFPAYLWSREESEVMNSNPRRPERRKSAAGIKRVRTLQTVRPPSPTPNRLPFQRKRTHGGSEFVCENPVSCVRGSSSRSMQQSYGAESPSREVNGGGVDRIIAHVHPWAEWFLQTGH